jgi:integrase
MPCADPSRMCCGYLNGGRAARGDTPSRRRLAVEQHRGRVRIGEASALQRHNLDLAPGYASISVREHRYPLKFVHDTHTPKSRADVRIIAVPTMLADKLRAHLNQLSGRDPSSLVFTTENGGNIRTTCYQMLRHPLSIVLDGPRPRRLRCSCMRLLTTGAGLPSARTRWRMSPATSAPS